MSKKASAFATWFIAQHGKRPSTLPINELRELRFEAGIVFHDARRLLEQCQDYDNRMQSALYAWNARKS